MADPQRPAETQSKGWQGLVFPVVACLTLGLAPMTPEPHVVGKLRWVAGGAVGMGLMDWFDLVMHGAPWIWLVIALVQTVRGLRAD